MPNLASLFLRLCDPLVLTLYCFLLQIGASIEYFKLGGETANQYRGNIWYYTLAIFVPIFALIGRIRRSTVFYSAAIVSAIISLATIVTTAHIFLTVVNTSEPSSSRDRFIVLFAGNILEILGMVCISSLFGHVFITFGSDFMYFE